MNANGYRQKPAPIVFIAVSYLFSPLINLLIILFMNNHFGPNELLHFYLYVLRANGMLQMVFLILWLFSFPLAFGLFSVRFWALICFVIHTILMFIFSFYLTGHFQLSFASIWNSRYMFYAFYLLFSEYRKPFIFPKLQWWKQPKRILSSTKVILDDIVGDTYDISERGMFVINTAEKVEIKHRYHVTIILPNYIVQCEGFVRWVNVRSNNYPMGFGVEFTEIPGPERVSLKNYIRELIRQSAELSRQEE